jgi:hypothetical protein
MELWEKQHAYISRRFVVVEVVESDHFVRGRDGRVRPTRSLVLAGSPGPRFCHGVAKLGGHHREPRQVSAVTLSSHLAINKAMIFYQGVIALARGAPGDGRHQALGRPAEPRIGSAKHSAHDAHDEQV